MNIFDFWAKYEYSHQTPGLLRIKKFFKRLGRLPDIPVVHIAGTNGKGMTASILANFLWQEFPEETTGLYTSPHLEDIGERIVANGGAIPRPEFQEISLYYFPLARECQLSFFEFLTAVALIWFQDKNCSRIVLETGLGGLYDATNICRKKLLAIITSVGYDHQKYLGNTLTKIAREKAGIIHSTNLMTILGSDIPNHLLPIFRQKSRNVQRLGEDFFVSRVRENYGYQIFDYYGQKNIFEVIFRQPGEKSIASAALAIRAAEFLKVSAGTVRRVLRNFGLAGRREFIRRGKIKMILDGAHNPAAIAAFWQDYQRWQKTFLSSWPAPRIFFTLVKDKKISQIALVLSRELRKVRWQNLIIYRLQSLRAQKPAIIFSVFKKYLPEKKMEIFPNLVSALGYYRKNILAGCPAIFIGSFYAVGELKKELANGLLSGN